MRSTTMRAENLRSRIGLDGMNVESMGERGLKRVWVSSTSESNNMGTKEKTPP